MSEPIQLRLTLEDRVLPIPYPPAKRPDSENFGYLSLIKHPEQIDRIPELRGEPAMQELIQSINAPGGLFETVRIIHFPQELGSRCRYILGVGFAFRNRQKFGQYMNCMMVVGNLLAYMNSSAFKPVESPLFEIQPAKFLEEDAQGWIMDFFVSGTGTDEAEARQGLAEQLPAVGQFLRNGVGSLQS